MTTDTVILVAEDDLGHFALIKKNLWRSCVYSDILHFKDGQEILDFLFSKNGQAKSETQPSFSPNTSYILLLDIRMPKVDGVEVLEKIKREEELRKIPVIMLTTTDDPLEVDRCYALGANLYISKPTDYNKFMDTIERLGNFLSLLSVKVPKIQPM
jgi:CheY-like chemotaxis protein